MATTFSPENLIETIDKTCEAIHAVYSEENTVACVTAFHTHFNEGVTLWRTSDEHGDSIKYRFYTAAPINVLRIAFDAQLLDFSHPLIPVLQNWLEPWTHRSQTDRTKTIITPEQRCEFDSLQGLTRVWVLMGRARPLEDVLSVPDVPEYITNYYKTFRDLGLTAVRKISVDFFFDTVTLHFEQKFQPFSRDELDKYIAAVDNISHMDPYEKADPTLSRVVPKPVTDMERTLAAGYTVEITIDLKVRTRIIYIEPGPESETGSDIETEFDTDTESDTETESSTETEFDTETELDIEAEYTSETESESEAEYTSETEYESEPDLNTEPDPDTDTESETKPEPLVETITYVNGTIKAITLRAVATQHISLPRIGARLYKFMDLTPNYGYDTYIGVSFAFEEGDFRNAHVEKVFSGRLPEMVGYGSEFDWGRCGEEGEDVVMGGDGGEIDSGDESGSGGSGDESEGRGGKDGDGDVDVEMGELEYLVERL